MQAKTNDKWKEGPNPRVIIYSLQEHASRILDILLNLHQKLNGFSAIQETVVVCQGQVHHRADNNLAVHNDWLILDSMEPKNSCLRKVDDWSTHQRAEDSTVADGESTTGHILNCQLAFASLKPH